MGDTTTLTVSVTGQGNVQNLVLPSPQWGEGLKVYEDQPVFRPNNSTSTISGEKVYTYALVPLKSGTLQVPPISLSYFEPIKREYVTLQTQALTLAVAPGKNTSNLKIVEPSSDASTQTGNSIKKIGEDILPIYTGPELYQNQIFNTRSALWYGIGLLLPVGLFILYGRFYRRQERLRHDIAFSRSHGAYKQAQKKLESLSPDTDSRKISRELSLIIREYLGNVLNLQGTAITSSEVKEKLSKGHFNEEEIQQTRKFLERHETFQYTPSGNNPSGDLIQEARDLLNRLEKKP